MYERKAEKDIRCPLEYAMDVFGGKWKSRVICLLNEKGVMRYSELKKRLSNVTDTVLASALKEMQESELVLRTQYSEIPPRVEYSLTKKGKSVVPLLGSMCKWAAAYQEPEEEIKYPLCNNCMVIKR